MFDNVSKYAETVDITMLIIVGISVFLLVLIVVGMVYFVFKYSRKKHPVAKQIHGNVALEIVWIVIPTILVIIMFWYGYVDFRELREETDFAMKVNVTGFMWGWEFDYDNGMKTDTLFVPVNRTTKLEMISRDVNHSFYIPAFRLKEDVVGGKYHYLILTPEKVGTYDVACAEYCGREHSYMYTAVKVLPEDAFDKWFAQNTNEDENEGKAENTSIEESGAIENSSNDEEVDKLEKNNDIEEL